MSGLRRQVERALDTVRPADGVIVVAPDGRVDAVRDPMPGAYAVVITIGDEPRAHRRASRRAAGG